MELLSSLKKESRDQPITIRLPKSACQNIKKLAKKTGRSQSEIVEIAIKRLAKDLQKRN